MADLPKRKRARLKGYDYNTPGAYFITICTHNKECLFSNIVGAIHESPENKLTQYGEFAEQIIGLLPGRFHVLIPKYVVMPNHIHLIIEINNDNENRAIRESPLQYNRSIIDKIVGFFKMNISKKMHNTYHQKIWQRSYHDHIIRSEEDYQKIWQYIDTNVLRWEKDCFYISEGGVAKCTDHTRQKKRVTKPFHHDDKVKMKRTKGRNSSIDEFLR